MEVTEKRVAIIGVIVKDAAVAGQLNALLHDYSEYLVARQGIPYRERGINVISLIVDAPQPVISALSGRIGRISGVATKTLLS